MEAWPPDLIFFMRAFELLQGLAVQLEVRHPTMPLMLLFAREALVVACTEGEEEAAAAEAAAAAAEVAGERSEAATTAAATAVPAAFTMACASAAASTSRNSSLPRSRLAGLLGGAGVTGAATGLPRPLENVAQRLHSLRTVAQGLADAQRVLGVQVGPPCCPARRSLPWRVPNRLWRCPPRRCASCSMAARWPTLAREWYPPCTGPPCTPPPCSLAWASPRWHLLQCYCVRSSGRSAAGATTLRLFRTRPCQRRSWSRRWIRCVHCVRCVRCVRCVLTQQARACRPWRRSGQRSGRPARSTRVSPWPHARAPTCAHPRYAPPQRHHCARPAAHAERHRVLAARGRHHADSARDRAGG